MPGERAVSSIVGEVLFLGVMVGFMSLLALTIMPDSDPPSWTHADMEAYVLCDGSWNEGNEQLVLRHVAGEAIASEGTDILLDNNGTVQRVPVASMGAVTADGGFSVGETWRSTYTIDGNATVSLFVVHVHDSGDSETIASLRGIPLRCV